METKKRKALCLLDGSYSGLLLCDSTLLSNEGEASHPAVPGPASECQGKGRQAERQPGTKGGARLLSAAPLQLGLQLLTCRVKYIIAIIEKKEGLCRKRGRESRVDPSFCGRGYGRWEHLG